MTAELNATGDQFGGYSFGVVDPSGHVIASGSGTVAGQLRVHLLLPRPVVRLLMRPMDYPGWYS
jgi:hypothetical protein